MKEKPILFSTEMVKAILEGRKTQTRRVVKDKSFLQWVEVGFTDEYIKHPDNLWHEKCPYGKPGDILWVRETWCRDDITPEDIYYKADFTEREAKELFADTGLNWKPSIHMPKEAARLFLKVTNVRVERLQDISEEDAMAEGVDWLDDACYYNNGWVPTFGDPDSGGSPIFRDGFAVLWDSLNSKRGYGWEVNPWVWVIEFEWNETPA